jgi:hypothetical protein
MSSSGFWAAPCRRSPWKISQFDYGTHRLVTALQDVKLGKEHAKKVLLENYKALREIVLNIPNPRRENNE